MNTTATLLSLTTLHSFGATIALDTQLIGNPYEEEQQIIRSQTPYATIEIETNAIGSHTLNVSVDAPSNLILQELRFMMDINDWHWGVVDAFVDNHDYAFGHEWVRIINDGEDERAYFAVDFEDAFGNDDDFTIEVGHWNDFNSQEMMDLMGVCDVININPMETFKVKGTFVNGLGEEVDVFGREVMQPLKGNPTSATPEPSTLLLTLLGVLPLMRKKRTF